MLQEKWEDIDFRLKPYYPEVKKQKLFDDVEIGKQIFKAWDRHYRESFEYIEGVRVNLE